MTSANIKENFKSYSLAVLCTGIICCLGYVLQTGCIIRYLTGVPCMGCGLTRAGIAILSLDFKKALFYNPCIFILVVSPVWILLDKNMQRKSEWFLVIFALVSHIVRMLLHNPIVQWEIQEGLIYKSIRFIMEVLK